MKINCDKWDMGDDFIPTCNNLIAPNPKWESLTRSSQIGAPQIAERFKTKLINEFLKEEMGNLTKERIT